MVQVSYPGVYIVEKSSGVRTITGVATSIAAFVDSFARGPLDEAVQCLGYADFEREFGGIDANSAASYGIKQFFQNGGGECWVVRVGDGALASEETLVDAAGDAMFRVRAGRQLRGEIAINPGAWGDNLRVDIDYDTTDAERVTRGIMSGERTIDGIRYVQTDASVNPGNSGGPLLDVDGQVQAIVTTKVVGTSIEGMALGVPMEVIAKDMGIVFD